MTEFTFAVITPSYAPDFQRCKLLCWSIKQFISTPILHYIIVDKKDHPMFRELSNSYTKILIKEEILPKWIRRIPFSSKKNIWFNFRGYKTRNWFLRGWFIQQVIKLLAAEYVEEDIVLFVDSDVAFIRPFNLQDIIRGNQVRLFRVENPKGLLDENYHNWELSAKRLLGLACDIKYRNNYVNQIVSWRRDVLTKLYAHIESIKSKNWLEALFEEYHLSEYTLYGFFVNYVLERQSLHYADHQQKLCHSYWETQPLSEEELKEFFSKALSSHVAIMISAKANTNLSIDKFQDLLSILPTFNINNAAK